MRQVTLPSGDLVPALGQGTWFMGENAHKQKQEITALQLGIDNGLTLIDTAEMYADGGAEKVVGLAIENRRDKVFLVSKVLPYHASLNGTIKACEASLRRMKTDYVDLYLLHWPGSIPLAETVNAMETLIKQGKIKHWGVSNFDVDDLLELENYVASKQLITNQVLYNLSRRGIEYDLLPWSEQYHLPTMAYSPIEQGRILKHPVLATLAQEHSVTPAQIALAWVLRRKDIIAIPKASSSEHVMDNINALKVVLSADDLATLDKAFPAPKRKQALEML
ncbi:aldo/keto reductase [Zophobihabitans entericus]|uniref:Aldo/keto reductase n=1 Tax=Zophobihabitans entericus TaxID=1635327 RepID=A0A6G9IFU2_9GAMM|nr:aldo/keto reductase [Zophobihabitans entericus]